MSKYLIGLVLFSAIYLVKDASAQQQAAAAEPTYSITLTAKQVMAIGALLDSAPCTISNIVNGLCDTLATYQAMNAQITEQNKARASAAVKDAPR